MLKRSIYLFLLFTLIHISLLHASKMDLLLSWDPGKDIDDIDVTYLHVWRKQRIMVLPLVDERPGERPAYIGRHGDDKVTTALDVPLWTTTAIRHVMREAGLIVVTDKPTIILQGRLVRFFVNEESIYRCHIDIDVDVFDAGGSILFQGFIIGEDGHWGSTFEEDEYRDVIGSAVIDWVEKILGEKKLVKAIENSTVFDGQGPEQNSDILIKKINKAATEDYKPFVTDDPPSKPGGQTITALSFIGAGSIIMYIGTTQKSRYTRRAIYTVGGVFTGIGGLLGTIAIFRWIALGSWKAQFTYDPFRGESGVAFVLAF